MENIKYIYDKNGNYIDKVFQGSDEEIKQQYSEDVYIIDIYLGEKVIIENDTIRAYTRLDKIKENLEELLEGEYIKDDEIILVEKPSNFHFWDFETNTWNYDKESEINALEEELGTLELDIYNKNTKIKELKEQGQTFAAKKLEKEVVELQKRFDEKLLRYEELEG